MKHAQKTVNAIGLQEIHNFLAENHKLGGNHFNALMLRAWARDAEFSLSEGNDAGIEIKANESVYNCTQTFTISDAGLDVEMIEINE
jgi:hypothetical protein